MSDHYVVELELDTRPPAAALDAILDHLADWHASAGAVQSGNLGITLTLPADGLRQAVATALALVEPIAPSLTVRALPERIRDERQGWEAVDDTISALEAAEILGVSRQRVQQMVAEGKLPRRRVGRGYVFPRAAVEALLPEAT